MPLIYNPLVFMEPLMRLLLTLLVIAFAAIVITPFSQGATLKPQVMGRRGIVAAGHPLVAEAGFRIMQKGGNAVDAGVASVFAAGVVEQGSFGLGGEAPILIKLKTQRAIAINGAGIAPELATADFYNKLPMDDPRRAFVQMSAGGKPGKISSFGPLSAIVPGAVDALLVSLENYGTLSFADVIQPAIELAQGFPIDQRLVNAIKRGQQYVEKWPATKNVFLPNGQVPKEGDIFVQADLARTLQEMVAAEKGASSKGRIAGLEAVREYFYRGPIAKRMSAFCEQNGCLLREKDFAAFQARIEAPVTTNYRGVDVYKAGFWSQSPVMIEILNLLEGFDLKTMGQNSPRYLHTLVEAMKLGYADRDAYYGDPDFSKIPQELLSKDYAKARRALIDAKKASAEHIPGDPEHLQARASADFIKARLSGRNGEHEDTTCVNVIDKDGNMFSATPSGAWLPSVIAGDTGIPLSIRLASFVTIPGHANQLAPGKRPRVTLSPTLVTKDGEFYMELSTPGGDNQDQALLQVLLNIIDFGMTPQEAVESPRFQSEHFYASFDFHEFTPGRVSLEGRLPRSTIERMIALGHKVQVGGEWSNTSAPVVIQKKDGVLSGAADPRRSRFVFGK